MNRSRLTRDSTRWKFAEANVVGCNDHEAVANAKIELCQFSLKAFLPILSTFVCEDWVAAKVSHVLCPLVDESVDTGLR